LALIDLQIDSYFMNHSELSITSHG